MRGELQLDKRHLPSVLRNHLSGINALQLVRMKKAELSKQLQNLQAGELVLPQIQNQNNQVPVSKNMQSRSFQKREEKASNMPTPQQSNTNRLKTVFDESQEKGKEDANFQVRSNAKNNSTMIVKKDLIVQQSRVNRTKTETKPRELSIVAESNQGSSNQKIKFPPEDESHQYDQYILKFRQYVESVPKNMKLRNEENLAHTIAQLERFNPFFNRNPKIINVCLLKIGRIVVKNSATIIYKAGEILHHFYIILLGKVKLVEGSFRRVCQTGETILQQILFAETKKASLERAKTVSNTYLLELNIQQYGKLKQELIRHGLKLQWQQMQAIIKRNFIIKNWMRKKKQQEAYK